MKIAPPTERQVQRSILSMAGICFPEVFLTHVPNGAYLGADRRGASINMGVLLGDGLKPGFVDLLAYWNHGHGLLEVKRPGCAGRLSPEQKRVHEILASMGFEPRVVTSSEEAFCYLKERGAPCRVQSWREAA